MMLLSTQKKKKKFFIGIDVKEDHCITELRLNCDHSFSSFAMAATYLIGALLKWTAGFKMAAWGRYEHDNFVASSYFLGKV